MHRSALVLLLLTVAPARATTPEASAPTGDDLHTMDERVEAIVARWRKKAAENPPVKRRDAVELWVQPLGSVLYGSLAGTTFQSAYVSAGVTVPLPQWWELVLEGAFQSVPNAYYGDGDGEATISQFWLSVGAVRFFQAGRPHDGFFVGPKLVFTSQQIGTCFGGECPTGYYPEQFAGAFTITCEAGYRLQFGQFALSFIFPSVGFGYGWNESLILDPNLVAALVGVSGFVMSFDFNMLRVGVSF
jgi:hypothetical protein